MSDHEHLDTAARVGYNLAWKCQICGRLEITDVRLDLDFLLELLTPIAEQELDSLGNN